MRRLDKEITDNGIIEEILHQSELCRLGLVDEGEAYVVPVNYAYQDGVIYFHSAKEGRKMNIMRRCEALSFEITYSSRVIGNEVACKWTTRYRSVMGRASISFITDVAEKRKALDVIMQKYGAGNQLVYEDASLARIVVVALTITHVTGKQSGDWNE